VKKNLSYTQALNFLYFSLPMFQRQGKKAFKKNLDNIKTLCHLYNNPQKRIATIHIAGTNGKGTTAHIIAALLEHSGLKVGLYTSPHYRDFRERIKINGALLEKKYVRTFVTKYQSSFQQEFEKQPSFFELTVAMAFNAFEDHQVDVAVIETGLGGRLDSTNIISPMLSIITNISFDHQSFLGNTLVKIAGEKAGIIKKNTPVLIGEHQQELEKTFRSKADKMKADLSYARDLVKLKSKKAGFEMKFGGGGWNEYNWTFDTVFQQKNLKTAIAAFYLLKRNNNIKFDPKSIQQLPKLLKRWKYIGRMQKIGSKPEILVDSAHNEAGMVEWLRTIKERSYKNLHIVVGFVMDKDSSLVLSYLPEEATYYFVHADIPRALSSSEVKTAAEKYHLKGKAYTTVRRGLAAAKRKAHQKDLICVVGSIFVVAEVL